MTPDVSVNWEQEDGLDTGRTMGEFIIVSLCSSQSSFRLLWLNLFFPLSSCSQLPDGRLWMGNGGHTGTAGYGNETWAVGRSYADQPLHQSWYFDPKAASGAKWKKAGVSTVDRLYHSTATLLPDGAVLVSGSNPNPDYVDKTIDPSITYVTEYKVEKVRRLSLSPLASRFASSGASADFLFIDHHASSFTPTTTMSLVPSLPVSPLRSCTVATTSTSLFPLRPLLPTTPSPTRPPSSSPELDSRLTPSTVSPLSLPSILLEWNVLLMLVDFLFSSLVGMRHLELESTYTVASDGTTTFHVSQMPPNAALFQPGPALLFCVVNG